MIWIITISALVAGLTVIALTEPKPVGPMNRGQKVHARLRVVAYALGRGIAMVLWSVFECVRIVAAEMVDALAAIERACEDRYVDQKLALGRAHVESEGVAMLDASKWGRS